MIYKKTKNIPNHQSYSYSTYKEELNAGYLAYFDNESVFRVYSLKDWTLLLEQVFEAPLSIIYRDKFYLTANDNCIYAVDLANGKIEKYYSSEEIEGYKLSAAILAPGVIVESQSKYENYSLIERKSKLLDTKSKAILYSWNSLHDLILLDANFVYLESRNGGEIICKNINTDSKEWCIELDNGSYGKRIISRTASVLYLQRAVTKPNHINLISLHKKSGSIFWELEHTFPHYNYDISTHKLYGLSGKTFEVINAKTGKRELQKELKENLHISSHLTYYDNGYLYFSGFKGKSLPVFGAVNVENGELEFTQEVKMPGEKSFRKGLDRPVVVGNRLYVRDAIRTLHIYEREDQRKE